MKMIHRFATLFLAARVCVAAMAAEQAAVVKEDHVNVRGRPSFVGEVITQLKSGESVVILEEITLQKPAPGEPAAWMKIKMPANTPVWVNASFIEAEGKTVKPARLNLRAGPGENFSAIGRLNRGEAVKPIRTVGDWMEIESPAEAFAFVAADLIKKSTVPNAPAAAPAATESKPSPPVRAEHSPAPPPVPTPAPSQPVNVSPAPVVTPPPVVEKAPETPPVVVKVPEPIANPLTIEPAVVPPGAAVVPVVPTAVSSAPAVSAEASAVAPVPKRIVTREGVVRRALSIQAPAYYELVSPYSGKVINYLHLEEALLQRLETSIKQFKEYLGRTIIVTGEEGIDPRWPTIPLIEVETLKLVL